jgi:hypothetical protein
MTLELTKSNRKYLALLEAVDAAQAEIRAQEAALSEKRATLRAALDAQSKFEGKHGGETLLKPHTLPTPRTPIYYQTSVSFDGGNVSGAKYSFYDSDRNLVARYF